MILFIYFIWFIYIHKKNNNFDDDLFLLYVYCPKVLSLFVKELNHKLHIHNKDIVNKLCQAALRFRAFCSLATAFFVVHMQLYYYVTRNDAVFASQAEGSCVRRSPRDSQAHGAEESWTQANIRKGERTRQCLATAGCTGIADHITRRSGRMSRHWNTSELVHVYRGC